MSHLYITCSTRHVFSANYPQKSNPPRTLTAHTAHMAHTEGIVIYRAQKLLMLTWCAHERQHAALQLRAKARLRQW